MAERELNRDEVLSRVSQGRITAPNASPILGLSIRQVHRFLKTFQSNGRLEYGWKRVAKGRVPMKPLGMRKNAQRHASEKRICISG